MEIEPLLNQIDQLATHFGRVTGDLQAISARGRAEDFRGVMQNTRLVLEAILRDLVTRELKQTVGKAMLDELITKFRQQTNAGIVPTNILAHMGTVQAWGNLSAHDHAGSLTDQGVTVGKQEVVASLNSMVAILTWYAGRLGVTLEPTLVRPPTKPPPPVQTPSPVPGGVLSTTPAPLAPVAPPPAKSPVPIVLGALGLAICLIGGFWVASRPSTPAAGSGGDKPLARANDFPALDAVYRNQGLPVPPQACRRPDEAEALTKGFADEAVVEKLHGPEADYALALARHTAGKPVGAELDRATACSGFAAALALSGKVAVREGEAAARRGDTEGAVAAYGRALRSFDAAIGAAPNFKNARFNRALVLLKQNKLDDGVHDLRELIAGDAAFSEAHFYLGMALEAQSKFLQGEAAEQGRAQARTEFCTAAQQGLALAKSHCEAGQ